MINYHTPLTSNHYAAPLSPLLQQVEQLIINQQVRIETWFRKQWQEVEPPVTCSVDLRNAGFKLAPVDTNLFPAGFNNLHNTAMPLAIQAAQAWIEQRSPGCERLLIVPEDHTRNAAYFASLHNLQTIFTKAGLDVKIGSLLTELHQPLTVETEGGDLTLFPLQLEQGQLCVDEFAPCIVLLNNDLSAGVPEMLQQAKQTLHPSLRMGWAKRRKSIHFERYQTVANEFATLLDIDPWLINPFFQVSDDINFMQRTGEDKLITQANVLFEKIRAKYREYQIEQDPFVVIKADSGTYGMAVMTITDVEQIKQLNRKQRNKMASIKGKKTVSHVLLQEGIHTFETAGPNQAVAEPVIYLLGQHVIGGFYRLHQKRGPNENLNAPGMQFEPLPFTKSCINPDASQAPEASANRFYVYGVVARLALLAAARESKRMTADEL